MYKFKEDTNDYMTILNKESKKFKYSIYLLKFKNRRKTLATK